MSTTDLSALPGTGPALILGAGYAGLRLVHTLDRLARGKIPIVLVDRHPIHVLRTELYEVGKLSEGMGTGGRFALPLYRALENVHVEYREGEVQAIDLGRKIVTLGGAPVPYRALAICLGSVPAYYGVPGAKENTHMVYRLRAAQRLGTALRDLERSSKSFAPGRRPRVVVVGGGSTGTEVAAEIATVPWWRLVGRGARRPEVTLVSGTLPLLSGLPEGLIRHARTLLDRAGVVLVEGKNVTRVDRDRLVLEDGREIPFDISVWAAGVQAPDLVRQLPVPHGRSGRVAVAPTLEIPGYPGVFGVGDVMELEDPDTHVIVPAMAQAALAEAVTAGENIAARWSGRPLKPFKYRERGAIVSVGLRAASGVTKYFTLWGRPAKLLKRAVEYEYSHAVERGDRPLVTR